MKGKKIKLFFLKWAIPVLVIFHLVGLFLFLSPSRIEGLSGLNILLCTVLVLGSAENYMKEFNLLLLIFIGGFGVECIGVNSSLLFGSYEYGDELGLKLWGVPLVLGLNWYCIVAAASHFVASWTKKSNIYLKSFLSGAMALVLDYWIEPVAIKYDFWHWEGGEIPIYNFLCWFVFATVFAFAYYTAIDKINKTACFLYIIWILFFIVLTVF